MIKKKTLKKVCIESHLFNLIKNIYNKSTAILILKNLPGEFPAGLVVRIQCFHHCGPGSFPSLGTEIPHQATAHMAKKKKKKKKVYPTRAEYTFFSAAHRTFTKIDSRL